jgi:cytochrome b involved in lipid metabolism
MFRELYIIVKDLKGTEIPISTIIQDNHKIVFLFSQHSKNLRSKFHDKPRTIVNTVTLTKSEARIKMFSLFEGKEVDESTTYTSLLDGYRSNKDHRVKYLFSDIYDESSILKFSSTVGPKKGPKLSFGPEGILYKLPQIESKEEAFDDLADIDLGDYENSQSSSKKTTMASKPEPPAPVAKAYDGRARVSKADLARHNSKTDAWTVVRGQVFDITDFIKKHPGGQASILKIMGTEGTKLFEKAHKSIDAGSQLPGKLVGQYIG